LLFEFGQGGLCVFGVDPPDLDRSLTGFERNRKLFAGRISVSRIVGGRGDEFPQFCGNGIDTLFRHLLATGGGSDDNAKRLGQSLRLGRAIDRRHISHLYWPE
jgi:hypothetical protein